MRKCPDCNGSGLVLNIIGEPDDCRDCGGSGIEEVTLAYRLDHNGRKWKVVRIQGSWFARDDRQNDTGPYSTPEEAIDWVKAIRTNPTEEGEKR